MISDYCHGDKDVHSEDFTAYVKERGYYLLSVKDYGNLLQQVLSIIILMNYYLFLMNQIFTRI